MSSRHLVLGVTGSISAYKAPHLLRELLRRGADVTPVLTEEATRFVGPLTFEALCGKRLAADLWSGPDPLSHTALARRSDAIVVAPATATIIAKAASGLADDLLSALLLSSEAPVVMAPAMHTEMWRHPATRHNVDQLRSRGVTVMEPAWGELAGFDEGPGRLPELEDIVSLLELVLWRASRARKIRGATTPDRELEGLSVVVTAGGTREPVDAVRFIGNRSSGKMGRALAREAWLRGADVVLVTTVPTTTSQPRFEEVGVETASEMRDAVLRLSQKADVLVMAAAVADFRPKETASGKIKKEGGLERVELERTPDILEEVASLRKAGRGGPAVVVGFAAETERLEDYARAKLEKKGLEAVVANLVGREGTGFGSDTNEATVYFSDGTSQELGLISKEAMARTIWDLVAEKFLEE